MRKLSYKHFALKGGTKDGPVHKSMCKVNVLHPTSTFRWHAYTSTCSKQVVSAVVRTGGQGCKGGYNVSQVHVLAS